jgi:2-iminobutanoate/2-iminopropanoate deaminase
MQIGALSRYKTSKASSLLIVQGSADRKGDHRSPSVETSTSSGTPTPIGPYNHIAKVGQFITTGGTAGVDPATEQLAGPDAYSQAKQVLANLRVMLESVGSDLGHVVHVNVFL